MANKKKVENIEPEIIEEVIVDEVSLVSIKDIIENGNDCRSIEIKEYLPLELKMQMVDDIVNSVVDINEEGMLQIDYKTYDLMFTLVVLREFTNINLQESDVFELYNRAYEYGIIDYVYTYIKESEIDYIRTCVERVIEQRRTLTNSLEGVVNRNINRLIERIPDNKSLERMTKNMSKTLKDFDPNKYETIQKMMKTIDNK